MINPRSRSFRSTTCGTHMSLKLYMSPRAKRKHYESAVAFFICRADNVGRNLKAVSRNCTIDLERSSRSQVPWLSSQRTGHMKALPLPQCVNPSSRTRDVSLVYLSVASASVSHNHTLILQPHRSSISPQASSRPSPQPSPSSCPRRWRPSQLPIQCCLLASSSATSELCWFGWLQRRTGGS